MASAAISALGTSSPYVYTTPSANIEVWSRLILQKSGRAPTDIVFSTGAFNLFLLDSRVMQSVWYQRSGDSKIEFGGQPLLEITRIEQPGQ